MRVALVAHLHHPIAEPFAGGLEAHVWTLADRLRRRGHDVTLFAGPGSDQGLGATVLDLRRPAISDTARRDASMGPQRWLDEHHAYLDLMLRLSREWRARFDVVHNHSLHHLPLAMAGAVPIPLVTTLHTPPTPWLESAIQAGRTADLAYAAVSRHTARAWGHLLPGVRVIPNGVDVERWTPGPGGGPLVWSGRLVPEKGPHLAIDAAVTAGRALVLAGPRSNPAYFDAELAPRLAAAPGVTYAGHLRHAELAALIGAAGAALVTPCWDEPYGLVVAEALACGTPVCGFERGGVREVVGPDAGVLVAPGDVVALAAAIETAERIPRAVARRRAETHCSLDAMVDAYLGLYGSLAAAVPA